VQWREFLAACHCRIGGLRGGAGAIEVACDHGIDGAVHRLNAGDAAFQEFARRQLLLSDQAACNDSGEVAGFIHGLFPPSSWPFPSAHRADAGVKLG
jgi:hypothetical protein